MPSGLTLAVIVILIVLGTVLVTEGVVRTARALRGIDERAVSRRLSAAMDQTRTASVDLLQPSRDAPQLKDAFLPSYERLARFLVQSGAPISMHTLLIITAILSVAAMLLMWLFLPAGLKFLAVPLGVLSGCGGVFGYISKLRSTRIATFEEQLPDAIELIVRSLRVGHPVSVAIAAVAEEMPAPIGPEFAAANGKVTYGMNIPDAFREMYERVPLADLGFLTVAFQIQAESGGNLVEALAKLANVIRDRYRMFRKVRAMTAEGRMSAWLLSCFPVAIGFALSVVRPGYYNNLSQTPHFAFLAALTVIFLALNVVVMVLITKIRV